jgi:glycosyltransferase involved in cell wall biosynthesis
MKKNTLPERAYVLITPARNEGAHIEKTIKSVVSQTVPPEKWVVVNDGSSDHTAEIVNQYAAKHHFIKLVNVSRPGQRNFGSKVHAFNYGYEYLRNVDFGFLGNLDADVEFGEDYFEKLLENFYANPHLGITGGIILEYDGNEFIEQNTRLNSVAGAVQLFRYRCYEQIGGYMPLELGGIDAVAEIMARKHGWKVQTFPELKVLHHRRVAAIKGKILQARFRQGVMNYSLGYHPLFQLIRCLFRIKDKPCCLGSLMMLLGYCWASFLRYKKAVPDDFVQYLRSEQKSKLSSFFLPAKSGA